MPKHDSIIDKLAVLKELEREPFSDGVRDELLRALANSVNIIIARAAEIMGRSGKTEFIQPLLARGEYLLKQTADADKACRAKEAIVQALDALGNNYESIYLRGIRYVQMEPVYGGRVDTAANFRGYCAQALARMNYAEAHLEIARLLFDPEMPARISAINAVTYLGDDKSELLLRTKVHAGDADMQVLGGCFSGLVAIAPERSVPFIAEFLANTESSCAEPAALALGESRLPEAFAILKARWENLVDYTFRKTLLLAIALIRSDDAFNFLLQIVREESRSAAIKALEVLDIYTAEERRREQIREAAQANGDPKVREALKL